MTRVTRVSSDNPNIAAEHHEPAEVLSQLGYTSTLRFTGSNGVTTVAVSGVLVATSGVLCDSSLFHWKSMLVKKSDGKRTKPVCPW